MKIGIPRIIQGGMGAGVSSWPLAGAVSRLGALGVVSGTALDQILVRRLQCGDPEGYIRRALQNFPFPRMSQRIIDKYYVPGGKAASAPYRNSGMHTVAGEREPQELCIAANFVEVFLAREGHEQPVGINYLEKIQLPHLPSIYGAMLAGAAVVIMGAGIPMEIPGVLDALAEHRPASYPVNVSGAVAGEGYRLTFDPRSLWEDTRPLPALSRPDFLPIVSSVTLAMILARRSNGVIAGFVVEGPMAGGHNAPPRGNGPLSESGEPVYGPRDSVDLEALRALGLPFWLAGGCGSPEKMRSALAAGAAGIQVGTAFALCVESGIAPELRRTLVQKALTGQARVFTDSVASPTGFPFKVAQLEGTLSDPQVYRARRRVCDLGILREVYRRTDGQLGYRCPAEPTAAFLAKGGTLEEAQGRACLCNALIANIGLPQILRDGSSEHALITLGDDFEDIGRFCSLEQPEYTAADVLRVLSSGLSV